MPHPGHESQPTSAREWSGAVPSSSTGLPILLEYLPWRLMFLGSFAETVDQERIVSGSASPPQPPQLRRHEGSPENDRSCPCPIIVSASLLLTYREYPAGTRTLNEGTRTPGWGLNTIQRTANRRQLRGLGGAPRFQFCLILHGRWAVQDFGRGSAGVPGPGLRGFSEECYGGMAERGGMKLGRLLGACSVSVDQVTA